MTTNFDDPRLRDSDRAKLRGLARVDAGDDEGAYAAWREASEFEFAVALEVTGSPRVRSEIAKSAVVLAIRGGEDWRRGQAMARAFLEHPEELTATAVETLRWVVDAPSTPRGQNPRWSP